MRKIVPGQTFLRERNEFYSAPEHQRGLFAQGPDWPIRNEASSEAGSVRTHYFQQDLYVAQEICAHGPERHIDVGSRIDGFVAHVAAFREIDVCDIRRLRLPVKNVTFHQLDLMEPLSEKWVACADSVSSLHAIEHFGLGRYGDSIDYNGHLTGLNNLAQMVRPGGALYFSIPIGKEQRVEFNAHRVFCLPYVLEAMVPAGFHLRGLAIVDDTGHLHPSVNPESERVASTFGLKYGCGIFVLRRG